MGLVFADLPQDGQAFGVCELEGGIEVMADCAGEEDGVLGDEGEAVAEGGDVYIVEGVVVYVDGACFWTGYG